jgi:5-methylthioadenosine/S-adenosylhomocysteine deaminase
LPGGQLLFPRYLLPVRPAGCLLEDYALRIVGQAIEAILPAGEARERFPDDTEVVLDRHVLLPGLINMHTHSPMSLLRGYADDLALQEWLQQHIWPAEQRWVSPEFVRDGTRLAALEMLRGGVTCFNEMYFFPEEIAAVAGEAGMRACLGVPIIDVPTPWANGLADCLARAKELIEQLGGHDRLQAALAPHATYTVDDAGFEATGRLADDYGVRVNMHLLEASWEAGQSVRQYGLGPLQRLHALGLLNDNLVAVHMVHLDAADIEQVAAAGVQVVHCPESNLKLASGFSPVAAMSAAGINISVGTDGAASNNNLDLLAELRTAALLAKAVASDPLAINAWQALDMVTINAARALGLDGSLGTLEPGKQADLCAMDLDAAETQPLHHVHSQLVYSASSRQFSDVWVAGRRLLDGGIATTLDSDEILGRARHWQQQMATA